MQGLVSVIIPVYNRENTIKRAIDSILCQTYSNLELIIVDDGSTDDTVSIINGYNDDRIRLICHKNCGGANKARNTGIANAKGEYIAFQDSDDEWLPDKLSLQIDAMESQKFLACYCPYYLYEGEVVFPVPYDYTDCGKYQNRLQEILKVHNVISTQTLMIKREVLELMNNEWFDELMPRLQDYELAIRLVQKVKIGYINVPLVNVYRLECCITRDTEALYEAVYRLISKHHGFLDIEPFLKAAIAANMIFDTKEKLTAGLNRIQQAITEPGIDIKDIVISYVMEQIKVQDDIDKAQYSYAVQRLHDYGFSIYGAGKVGQKVYQELNSKGLRPKSFIVSECRRKEYIYNVPIISIDECVDKESMVIIGIAKSHRAEMVANLIERKFKLFCIYPY